MCTNDTVTMTMEIIIVITIIIIKIIILIWISVCVFDSVAKSACQNLLRARAAKVVFHGRDWDGMGAVKVAHTPSPSRPHPIIIFKTELLMELAKVKQNAPPSSYMRVRIVARTHTILPTIPPPPVHKALARC